MASIEVEGLVVRYGEVLAVNGASFAVNAGEVAVLLGPNGAGKTSTVETLEGYQRPHAGAVRVLGLDPVADARALRPRVGVMLQSGGVQPGLRPPEVLALHAAFYDDPHDPAAMLERFGLSARRRATWRQLSGGEQQRLSLALALIGRPDVVFLDEPTAGIDLEGRRLVRELIAEVRAAGTAVLLTTHDLDEAERVADRVVIIDRGRVVANAPAHELVRLAGGDELAFTAAPGLDIDALGAALGGTVRSDAEGEYIADVAPSPANVAAVTAWLAEREIPIGDLRAGRRRLEDVLDRFTGDGPGTP